MLGFLYLCKIFVLMYNILLLGSGGREHAIAQKVSESPLCNQLFTAPGNPGTAQVGTNVSLDIVDFFKIEDYCKKHNIHWVIVGPEQPLVEGIYDYFKESPIRVFGPSKEASLLEGSKTFANDFMAKYNIPTGASKTFTFDQIEEGKQFIDDQSIPIVLKADGLAAGKGVLIIQSKEEAKEEFEKMLKGKFGDASRQVVVETFLDGVEFSVFAMTNGKEYILLPEAKDYKRIGEGDVGLNTGGMGAVSPVPFFDEALKTKVIEKIVSPTINGINEEGFDYYGFVFFGLILVGNEPYVIEYNVRMGDPETEVVFPRIDSDIISLMESCFEHRLNTVELSTNLASASTVMLVSGGYPETYEKNKLITMPPNVNKNQQYFFAGTKNDKGELRTNGGRVIACTAFGNDIQDAVLKSNEMAELVDFEAKYYRKDIGQDLFNYLKK